MNRQYPDKLVKNKIPNLETTKKKNSDFIKHLMNMPKYQGDDDDLFDRIKEPLSPTRI